MAFPDETLEWDTNETNQLEPLPTYKQNGMANGSALPAGYYNWRERQTWEWIKALRSRLAGAHADWRPVIWNDLSTPIRVPASYRDHSVFATHDSAVVLLLRQIRGATYSSAYLAFADGMPDVGVRTWSFASARYTPQGSRGMPHRVAHSDSATAILLSTTGNPADSADRVAYGTDFDVAMGEYTLPGPGVEGIFYSQAHGLWLCVSGEDDIYSTDDITAGAVGWTLRGTGLAIDPFLPYAVNFFEQDGVTIVSGPGHHYARSTDGVNWTSYSGSAPFPGAGSGEEQFVVPIGGSSWLSIHASDREVHRSDDGGLNWALVSSWPLPDPGAGWSFAADTVAASGRGAAVLPIVQGSEHYLVSTVDDGESWRIAALGPDPLDSISMGPGILTFGTGRFFLPTRDDGATYLDKLWTAGIESP